MADEDMKYYAIMGRGDADPQALLAECPKDGAFRRIDSHYGSDLTWGHTRQ